MNELTGEAMMLQIRKAEDRGHANHGWLDSYHTFSFADYYDPEEMSFGVLRVINEDFVQPSMGFGTHGHRDMEIVTYVMEGALEHKDSMGTGSVIRPGDIQRMSAGSGVTHSEFNASKSEQVHLLQIWILPKFKGIRPGYEEKFFAREEKLDNLRILVSPDGRDGSISINQDAYIYATVLSNGARVTHQLASGRRAYVHVVKGGLRANGELLRGGDGAKISDEEEVMLEAVEGGEALIFDLP
jgi:redox-sensitive bicupin YhaK (pirin superfamily)